MIDSRLLSPITTLTFCECYVLDIISKINCTLWYVILMLSRYMVDCLAAENEVHANRVSILTGTTKSRYVAPCCLI